MRANGDVGDHLVVDLHEAGDLRDGARPVVGDPDDEGPDVELDVLDARAGHLADEGQPLGDRLVRHRGDRLGAETAAVICPLMPTMSASRAAIDRTLRPPPPMRIGGCGRCAGFG